MLLEVIATTLSEAIDIEKYGGDRIELVTGVSDGGLTPSIALVDLVSKSVNIPVYVMLRPHSKSFVYDEFDKSVIINDLKAIKKTNAKGIVFGALKKDGSLDIELLEEVIKHKGDLKLVFHRAIDRSNDPIKVTKQLLNYDVERILTSGGKDTAMLGYEVINQMVKLTKDKITILAGSGLKPSNIKEFLDKCHVSEVHMGSGLKYEGSNMNDISEKLIKETLNLIK